MLRPKENQIAMARAFAGVTCGSHFSDNIYIFKIFLKSAKWSYAKLTRENSVSMLKKLLSHVKHF